ncbi:MAG: DUF1631 family protein [Xanthomonadales bacterium]|nr:DUF1631 family protein [Xanthomonadales bacterium]
MNKTQILKECIVIFDKHILVALKESMSLSLNELFRKAQQATSNQQEQVLFNQYRQLKSGAKNLSSHLRSKIKSMPDFISQEVNKSDSKMSLSLVEDEELAISLALTQMDSNFEVVSHAELYTLEKRMNVIFGNEKIDKTNMPFSPASIVWLFSHVFKQIDFDVEVKTLIIDHLIKEFGKSINKTYHQINDVFIKAGILPNIQPEIIKPKAANNEKLSSKTVDSREPVNEAEEQNAPQVSLNQQKTETGKVEYQGDVQRRQYDPESKDMLENIFNLLSPKGQLVKGGPSAQVIKDTDFDQALSQIAKESGVVATSNNIQNLKDMLADQVRNITGNYYPELTEKQNKTLDLMGMVYDEIIKDESIDTNIRSSFNAINVPLLRTAISDESFFIDTEHPARRFMELLVESSQQWHGTNVIKQIHQYSDTAAKSFDGTTGAFVKALKELSDYLSVTKNRAVRAEKKWISAAQGKEKMDLTKAEVESHLTEILEGCDVKFVKDIINHVWRDSLTLTLLREGKESEQWQKKIQSAKTISLIGNKQKFAELTGPEKISAIHHLDKTMDELGFSKRDRLATKDNIHTCLGWQESDESKDTDKPKLKKVLSIDEVAKSEEIETENKKIEEIRELTDEERAMKERVVNLPYGTLFDFIINQQNETLRRKLSWVSTMSESALFVDLLGRHPHKMKLQRLAIDLCRKNIIKVELPQGGYFKNALTKIMNKLKKMAA